MLSRRYHLWTLWLAPLLIARTFVPGGFMISVESGRPALTLCPGIANHATGHDPHAEHGGAHRGQSDGAAHDAPCPFALMGAALGCSIPSIATVLDACEDPLQIYASHHSKPGPDRPHHARGPPRSFPIILV